MGRLGADTGRARWGSTRAVLTCWCWRLVARWGHGAKIELIRAVLTT